MATLTERYPDVIARGAEGGHAHFSTTVVVSAGGYEQRNANWQDARGRWNVARAIERSGKHQLARAHFLKARGRLHQFRFKDWADFTATRTGLDKGRLTGAVTAWQLAKAYGTDEPTYEYVRPLHRIVAASEQIWRNTTLQTRGVDYTINNDTGAIVAAVSWAGATLEMSCQFDVLCRYEMDEYAARLVQRKADGEMLLAWENIEIVEVRE